MSQMIQTSHQLERRYTRYTRIADLSTDPRDDYTLSVAADYLRMHPRTLQRRIEEGRIAGLRDGRCWRVRKAALLAYAGGV